MIDGDFPDCPAVLDLISLSKTVEEQRNIVDARLYRSACWRGQLRREVHKYAQAGEVPRYIRAFNELAVAASDLSWRLNAAMLQSIHNLAVGGSGFRTVRLIVGGHHQFCPPREIPGLVDEALTLLAARTEPDAAAATRLHLSLLTIHPFEDGNGRSARLAAGLWLIHCGFRSTLFTAVEQHFHSAPERYFDVLDQFRYDEISEDGCVAHLLQAMIANAMYAAWFRARERRLRAYCLELSVPSALIDGVLVNYDTEARLSEYGSALARIIDDREMPLHAIKERLNTKQCTELSIQVGRLLDEEQDQQEQLRRALAGPDGCFAGVLGGARKEKKNGDEKEDHKDK